jgi:hypothetical protein
MAGLLNIVPRYLPRYGMAPDWTRATRPLTLIFTAICFLVTIAFKADVDAQAGAYATGVLALMTSATIAVTLSARRNRETAATWWFGIVTLIFIYTTFVNIRARPEGLGIAVLFIVSIVVLSFVSRVSRSTELRVERVELDELAQSFIEECSGRGVRVIANKPHERDAREYAIKEDQQRENSHIPASLPIVFLEVEVSDASEFSSVLHVRGVDVDGYKVLRTQSSTVPNAIAAFLLHLRETTGRRPHAYFSWSEGNPIVFMMRYLLLGEGDTAPVTREVLRKAERRPRKATNGSRCWITISHREHKNTKWLRRCENYESLISTNPFCAFVFFVANCYLLKTFQFQWLMFGFSIFHIGVRIFHFAHEHQCSKETNHENNGGNPEPNR